MSFSTEQYAYFTIIGEFEPDLLSASLRLLPSEAWRKGDLRPGTQRVRNHSRWSLYSRLPHSETLDLHMEDVLLQMDQQAEAFRQVAQSHQVRMQLVAYIRDVEPAMFFSASLMARMASYALELDFDFYYCRADLND